jgi:hypothetical protein
VLRVQTPRHPVHPRGAVRGEASDSGCPQRHIQVLSERGARHLGILLCLGGEPFQSPRDGDRARRPVPRSCRGAAMTPGVACAAPGPTDGSAALAWRPRRLPRARLSRLAVPGGVPGRVGCGRRGGHRSSAPLRLPHARPAGLRVPACPSVPVVPACWWRERPGGAAGLSWGSWARAVDAPGGVAAVLIRDLSTGGR